MAAKGGKVDDHNYELENEILRRRIQTVEKLIGAHNATLSFYILGFRVAVVAYRVYLGFRV